MIGSFSQHQGDILKEWHQRLTSDLLYIYIHIYVFLHTLLHAHIDTHINTHKEKGNYFKMVDITTYSFCELS